MTTVSASVTSIESRSTRLPVLVIAEATLRGRPNLPALSPSSSFSFSDVVRDNDSRRSSLALAYFTDVTGLIRVERPRLAFLSSLLLATSHTQAQVTHYAQPRGVNSSIDETTRDRRILQREPREWKRVRDTRSLVSGRISFSHVHVGVS